MNPDRPTPPEYSNALEHAEQARLEIADTDRLIKETQDHLEELKKDRETAAEDNDYAKEHGLTAISVAKIDSYIQEAEQALVDFANIRAEFVELVKRLESADQKGKDLLEKYHFGKPS